MASNPALPATICALEQVRGTGDVEIARIAELQRWLVHRRQLLAAGIGRGAIAHRLQTKRMHAVYRDVYMLGRPRVEPFALATAAALHLHPRVVLSHRTAAALWEMLDNEHDAQFVELTLIARSTHPRRGVKLHRVASLPAPDARRHRGLPVTSPARTLIDLAGCLNTLELESALAQCRARNLARDSQIKAALQRAPGRAGCARLRALLDAESSALTRSKAERILIAMLRAADLPEPVANAPVCGYEVDLVWPAQRLIAEFDGWETHQTRTAFESDRRRDQRLTAAGYRVIRITWWQLQNEPYAVIARIAAALHTNPDPNRL
ncbi:MAG: DUF559 domain-containing protein [Solirubrobacteraceae bacterium]